MTAWLKLPRDRGQHRQQRGAVGGSQQLVEARFVLGGDELLGARQHRPALVGQDKNVGAPIVGRANPRTKIAAFQAIEHRHEIRPQDAKGIGDLGLVAPRILLEKNPGRNQTEIANTLGILRPNFVAMLDGLESRDLCARIRSTNDRRSHILVLTDKGRAVLARAKKLVAAKHEARLNELLGPANRAALQALLATIAKEF